MHPPILQMYKERVKEKIYSFLNHAIMTFHWVGVDAGVQFPSLLSAINASSLMDIKLNFSLKELIYFYIPAMEEVNSQNFSKS